MTDGFSRFREGFLAWCCCCRCKKGMQMANKVVVLAIFKDEAAADAAAQSVKNSGLANDDAIGVLVLNNKGEVKAEKVGKRSTGKVLGSG